MTKPIEDSANASAIRTALDVPTNAALNEKYTKPANGIPVADLEADPTGRLLLTATSAAERKQVLGLDQVNNTSDANKPVSTAQAEALATKMNAQLPALQTVFDYGTAAQKAAFQASVSGALTSADVVIYGGTPAGVAAAVAAARLGCRALILSESERIGGMLGWGINHQDVNVFLTPSLVSAAGRDVLSRAARQNANGARTWQRWVRLSCDGRPSWFIRALHEYLAEQSGVRVIRNAEIISVQKTGAVITSITCNTEYGSQVIRGSQFVDASYCGDLARLAGTTGSIGRESNATYGESSNGVRASYAWNGLTVDPYITPGSAASGRLPFVEAGPAGVIGSGDQQVMQSCFRLFVTTQASNRIPFPAPNMATYSASKYEVLARAMAAGPTNYNSFGKVVTLYQSTINPQYFDLNTKPGMSTNFPDRAKCLEYVTASAARRAEIREEAKQWTLGLFYWIMYSGDSRIPAALVTDIANYGLVADELQAYGGFSPEFYVREGRRVVGDFVMNETHLTLGNGFRDKAIAFAYYDLDGHTVRLFDNGGNLNVEGSILTALSPNAAPQVGSPIPVEVLFPKRAEVTNLTCPGCPSVSRVIWTTLRMEPSLLMLGQAAGICAAMAIQSGKPVQDTDTYKLSKIMDPYDVWDGIVLSTDGSYAEGTITQSPASSWTATQSRWGFVGTSALSDSNTGKGKTLTFAPNIQETGAYEVFFRYPPDASRETALPVVVSHAGGTVTLPVNQTYPGGAGGGWESLGVYTFRRGIPSSDFVRIDTTGTTNFVVASAVKFRKVGGW